MRIDEEESFEKCECVRLLCFGGVVVACAYASVVDERGKLAVCLLVKIDPGNCVALLCSAKDHRLRKCS